MTRPKRIRQDALQKVVNAYLDSVEEEIWALVETETEGTNDVLGISVALMETCGGDAALAINAFEDWYEATAKRIASDQARRFSLDLMKASIVLIGIGNLAGLTMQDGPGWNAEIAQEGLRRGWRWSGSVS